LEALVFGPDVALVDEDATGVGADVSCDSFASEWETSGLRSRLMVECQIVPDVVPGAVPGVSIDAGLFAAAGEGAASAVGAEAGELSLTGEVAPSGLAAGAPRSTSPAVIGTHSVGSACGVSIGAVSGSPSFCANAESTG